MHAQRPIGRYGGAANIQIRPLTPDTFPALETLFSEGGDPGWCWCMAFRTRASEGGRSRREENREGLRDLVASGGRPPGLVALRGERAVGWVSVGPREDFVRLQRSHVYAPVDEAPVWSIVCFVVSRGARGQGLTHTLLEAAIRFAEENGATMLEAYPRDLDGSGGTRPKASGRPTVVVDADGAPAQIVAPASGRGGDSDSDLRGDESR